jgi:hypothetical protein
VLGCLVVRWCCELLHVGTLLLSGLACRHTAALASAQCCTRLQPLGVAVRCCSEVLQVLLSGGHMTRSP